MFHSSLRPLDIEFMKRLSKVVNIVPVIAKADTLTLEERVYFKQRVGLHSPHPHPYPRAATGLLAGRSADAPPPPHSRGKRAGKYRGHQPPEVMAKADTVGQGQLTTGMVPTFLPPTPQITADLLSNGIDVYPQKEFDEDAEDRLVNEKFRVSEGPGRCACGGCGQASCPSRSKENGGGVALSPENALAGARVSTAAPAQAAPPRPTCDHALPSPRR